MGTPTIASLPCSRFETQTLFFASTTTAPTPSSDSTIARPFSGPRIDDVVVALAVHHVAAFVVAGGAERVIAERERRKVLPLLAARIANAGLPVGAVRLLALCIEIAARLNEERGKARVREHGGGLVDGVSLGDAAEADLRLSLRELDGLGVLVERDVLPADEGETLLDRLLRGRVRIEVLVELP